MGAARPIEFLLVLGLLLTSRFTPPGTQSNVSATPTISIPALEKVVHEGDIVLKGNESMTLDRINYTQIGDIVVTDNAILRIASSILRIDGSENGHHITVNDSGRLWLLDSIIEGRGWLSISLAGDADAYLMTGSVISEVMENGREAYSSGFYLTENSSLKAHSTRFGFVWVRDNASFEVHGSFIGDFYPASPIESFVEGSRIASMKIEFRDVDLEIRESIQGYYESWDTGTAFGEGCTSTVRLVDTEILEPFQILLINGSLDLQGDFSSAYIWNGSRLSVKNSHLESLGASGEPHISVENSTIEDLRGAFLDGNATISLRESRFKEANIIGRGEMNATIEDCTFGYLQMGSLFSSYGPGNVDVRDTIIRNLTILPGGPFTYDFENVTVEEGFQRGLGSLRESNQVILKGSLRFCAGASFGGDRRSEANFTRWYDVEFRLATEGSVTLELKRGNETIWTRSINREGGAEFSVNYIDYFRLVQPYIPGEPSAIDLFNMTDTFTLAATTPGASAETRVGLLTDTPILLELEPGAPSGEESTITSAILLAVALIVAIIVWTRFRR